MKKLKVTIVALQELTDDELQKLKELLSTRKDLFITELENEMKQNIGSDDIKVEVELIEE